MPFLFVIQNDFNGTIILKQSNHCPLATGRKFTSSSIIIPVCSPVVDGCHSFFLRRQSVQPQVTHGKEKVLNKVALIQAIAQNLKSAQVFNTIFKITVYRWSNGIYRFFKFCLFLKIIRKYALHYVLTVAVLYCEQCFCLLKKFYACRNLLWDPTEESDSYLILCSNHT